MAIVRQVDSIPDSMSDAEVEETPPSSPSITAVNAGSKRPMPLDSETSVGKKKKSSTDDISNPLDQEIEKKKFGRYIYLGYPFLHNG